jgi:hypothetical protein
MTEQTRYKHAFLHESHSYKHLEQLFQKEKHNSPHLLRPLPNLLPCMVKQLLTIFKSQSRHLR